MAWFEFSNMIWEACDAIIYKLICMEKNVVWIMPGFGDFPAQTQPVQCIW